MISPWLIRQMGLDTIARQKIFTSTTRYKRCQFCEKVHKDDSKKKEKLEAHPMISPWLVRYMGFDTIAR